jgi:hypothetical protein
MASFSTNCVTPATNITTALATAVSNAQTLRTNLAAGLPGTTLVNLATSTTGWRMNVGELRRQLDTAIADLAAASQEFSTIANLLGNIATLD